MTEADKHSLRSHAAWRGKYRSRSHDAAHAVEADVSQLPSTDNPRISREPAIVVDTQDALDELLTHLREVGSFAYDSEFIGEMSYLPRLCLVQVGTEEGVWLIDPLADVSLNGFWELLADPAVRKIVHAGQQDVEPVIRILGRPAQSIVDTQIAGGFIGLAYPTSLQRLVEELLGIHLSKGLTFTDWTQRPLSAQQLRYAADDVRYLPAMWHEIEQRFPSPRTLLWLKEQSDTMCSFTQYQFSPETACLRIKGASSLKPFQLGMLRELAIWRDAAAREADLPPRAYLKDEILIDLCRNPVKTPERLAAFRGLPHPVVTNHADAILKALVDGAAQPMPDLPGLRKIEQSSAEEFTTDSVSALLQVISHAQGIDAGLVASRADLAAMLADLDRPEQLALHPLMQGWRKAAVGDQLLAVLREKRLVQLSWVAGRLCEQ
jgi:ribonuclease D